jgi:hypothetical protein
VNTADVSLLPVVAGAVDHVLARHLDSTVLSNEYNLLELLSSTSAEAGFTAAEVNLLKLICLGIARNLNEPLNLERPFAEKNVFLDVMCRITHLFREL